MEKEVGTAVTELLPKLETREQYVIANLGTVPIYVTYDGAGDPAVGSGIPLAAGERVVAVADPMSGSTRVNKAAGPVRAIASATTKVFINEWKRSS